MKVGILGSGLTGLTIAKFLECDYEVLEKEKECGGLCRSINDEGFVFDYGGAHAIFSRDKEILGVMVKILGSNTAKNRRNSKVFFKGRYVKYPFENGLSDLPKKDNFECLYHYLKNDYKKPTNFKEWIYYTFGKGIAEKYMVPYNEKIWNIKAELMNMEWVEGRIPKPPVGDVVKSSLGIETEGYKHQLFFYYPLKGGIQAFIKSLESGLKITRNFEIKKVIKEDNKWIVSDGKDKREFDKIVSTIPIFDLINCLDNVPEDVKKAISGLRYNSLITVLIGIDKEHLSDISWLYIPDKEFAFHKMSFPKNYSKFTVPEGKSAVMAEITANKEDGFWEKSDKEIIEHVVNGLNKMKIINKNDIFYTNVIRSKYAYIVYTIDYYKNLKIVKDFIKKQEIEICGRFAEFEYLNMDACIKRGIAMAKNMRGNKGRLKF